MDWDKADYYEGRCINDGEGEGGCDCRTCRYSGECNENFCHCDDEKIVEVWNPVILAMMGGKK